MRNQKTKLISLFSVLVVSGLAYVGYHRYELAAFPFNTTAHVNERIRSEKVFLTELKPVGRGPSALEARALLETIQQMKAITSADERRALMVSYVAAYPDSPYAFEIRDQLGEADRAAGRFSVALSNWMTNWEKGKALTDRDAVVVVNRSLGRAMRLMSAVGRVSELDRLLAELKASDRALDGGAVLVNRAEYSLGYMKTNPGSSYTCGVHALSRLAEAKGIKINVSDYPSPATGFSMETLKEIADAHQLDIALVKRVDDTAKVVVPSVVHWSLDHYAAILSEEKKDVYRVEDPTFALEGNFAMLTATDLMNETDGYFIMAKADVPATGYREITMDEAGRVFGKGQANNNCGKGMCVPGATPEAFAHVTDAPLTYKPFFGPEVEIRVSCSDANTEDNLLQYTTFGDSCFALSFDDFVTRVQEGLYLVGSSSGGQVYFRDRDDGAGLVHAYNAAITMDCAVGDTSCNITYPDGSVDRFEESGQVALLDGNPILRLVERRDSLGNALTIVRNDDTGKIEKITDATGKDTTFTYTDDRLTAVTSPFGERATFSYDANGRLAHSIDSVGVDSEYQYGDDGLIESLVTPYGETRFVRWLELREMDPEEIAGYIASGGFVMVNEDNESTTTETDATRYLAIQYYTPTGTFLTQELFAKMQIIEAGVPETEPETYDPRNEETFDSSDAEQNYNPNFLIYRNFGHWTADVLEKLDLSTTNLSADGEQERLASADFVVNAVLMHFLHPFERVGLDSPVDTFVPIVESIREPMPEADTEDERLAGRRTWVRRSGQEGETTAGKLNSPTRTTLVDSQDHKREMVMANNDLGLPTEITDPDGRKFCLTYRDNNRDVSAIEACTEGEARKTLMTVEYSDARPLPSRITDAAGRVQTFEYNTRGQLTRRVAADGGVFTQSYGDDGRLLQAVSPNGASVNYEYDEAGFVSRIVKNGKSGS